MALLDGMAFGFLIVIVMLLCFVLLTGIIWALLWLHSINRAVPWVLRNKDLLDSWIEINRERIDAEVEKIKAQDELKRAEEKMTSSHLQYMKLVEKAD